MCSLHTHQLDKQGSSKIVVSMVVSGMFGDFSGRQFSYTLVCGWSLEILTRAAFWGAGSYLRPISSRAAAFSSLIEMGFGRGFLLTEDACMESENSRHFFCIKTFPAGQKLGQFFRIHWVIVQHFLIMRGNSVYQAFVLLDYSQQKLNF